MKPIIALLLLIFALPGFGQSPDTKKYVWWHPWFKKDMSSDQPPPWPYRVIEEKNGVIRVEVTPPAQKTDSVTPPPTTSDFCSTLEDIADAATVAKIKGASKSQVEIAVAAKVTEAAHAAPLRKVVESVYNNTWTPAEARKLIGESCRNALAKNMKPLLLTHQSSQSSAPPAPDVPISKYPNKEKCGENGDGVIGMDIDEFELFCRDFRRQKNRRETITANGSVVTITYPHLDGYGTQYFTFINGKLFSIHK